MEELEQAQARAESAMAASREALRVAELRETRLYQQVRGLTALSRSEALAKADLPQLSEEACGVIAATLSIGASTYGWLTSHPRRCVRGQLQSSTKATAGAPPVPR